MMKSILYAAVILAGLTCLQVIAEMNDQSEQYWEEVGPNVDRSLNPNKYEGESE